MTAVGCQRETEAQRRLLWAIWTNAEGGAFEWKTGLEGGIPRIGKVVGLANNLYAGRAIGGRISAASGRSVTVDRDITAKSGDRLIVNLPTGKSEGRTVSSVNGRVITVTVPYSVQPVPEAQWGIDADDLALTQVRVKKSHTTTTRRSRSAVFSTAQISTRESTPARCWKIARHRCCQFAGKSLLPISRSPAGIQLIRGLPSLRWR